MTDRIEDTEDRKAAEAGNAGDGGAGDNMTASTRRAVRRTVVILSCIVAGMVGMSFAAVPLYNLFCRITGYGGTTQVAEEQSKVVLDRKITVRFNADTARNMPWQFRPLQKEVTVRIGETGLAFYEAYNPTNRRIVGNAAYNVTPSKAGLYFDKIACFCFDEQVLEPGQRVEMPVQFFVDPEIVKDSNLDEVKTITLSYTFFVDEEKSDPPQAGKNTPEDQRSVRLAAAGRKE